MDTILFRRVISTIAINVEAVYQVVVNIQSIKKIKISENHG